MGGTIFEQNINTRLEGPIRMVTSDIKEIKEIYISYWGERGLYKDTFLQRIIIQKLSYCFKINNKLIAFCLMYYNSKNKIVNISLICVRKEYKGKGLGTSILKFCINNCINKKAKTFDLHVSTTNEPAKKLYTKLGFKPILPIIKQYYHDENPEDNDAYYMVLKIP